MTPYERIKRNTHMAQFGKKNLAGKNTQRAHPRNEMALAYLSIAACPLAFRAIINPSTENILGYGGGLAVFALGFWAISQGLKNENIYHSKPVSKGVRFPLKALGAALVAIAAGYLTIFGDGGWVQAIAVVIATAVVSMITFGFDPMTPKGLTSQDERDIHAIDKIYASVGQRLDQIRDNSNSLGDAEITPAVRDFDASVNALLNAAERDPERLRSLRKYFGVYLDGATEASERFAAVYAGTGSLTAKTNYVDLLKKLTHAFDAKAKSYAKAGQTKLDVQIDVLNDSLAAEQRLAS